MADVVAKKMSQASANKRTNPPKKDERFRCMQCGMEIQVTANCKFKDGEHVSSECCGQELAKV